MATTNKRKRDGSKERGTPIVTSLFVNLISKRLSASVLACIIIASSPPVGFAQQDSGAVRISGNILPSLKLTVVGNQFRGAGAANVSRQPSAISRQLSAVSYQLSEDGWRATVASQGRTFADIRLAREGETSASHITIPLEIRTNAAYQLKLSLVTPDGCAAGVRAYTDSARAGGMRVAADAITNSRRIDISNLSQAASATAVFSGTRVSMGGNFVTPGNALLVHLNLVFPEGQPRCEGQPVIRLSLEPSI